MSDGWTNTVAVAEATGTIDAVNVPGTKEWTAKRDALLVAWQETKRLQIAAVNDEREARAAVVAFVWPDEAARKVGMNNHDLGNGYTLKFGNSISYGFGDNSNEKIEAVMDDIEKVGNIGPVLVDRVIKTKYEPSITEYKALNVDNQDEKAIKEAIDKILITKPGSPQLEIKEPKATLRG